MTKTTSGCMATMRLIDTNVFVYALGCEHPYREPSLQTLHRISAGAIEGNVSGEILSLEGIISADRVFDNIDGLKRFDPKELAA